MSKIPSEARNNAGRARAHTPGRREGRARDSATTGSKTDWGGDRLGARRGGRETTGSSDMTSALASQLQVVAASRPQEERLRGKASLLYDIREAADIDLQTIYSVGLQGTRASYRNPRRARRVSVPRRARAPNIQPRNRRRRPLSGGDCAFRVPPPWAAAREYVTP